ncbi:MAG: hypothetical protein ACXWEJ_04060 [Actinomycetota bacterium]
MTVERTRNIESLEELEGWRSDELDREEQGDAALDRLIERFGEPETQGPVPEPYEIMEDEFACRGCRLIFSRSCLVDEARLFCQDCAALAAEAEPSANGVPQVHGVHHPCPACGALVMVPERGEVSCGFVCPSCRVHLSMRGDHVQLSWDHRETVGESIEPRFEPGSVSV